MHEGNRPRIATAAAAIMAPLLFILSTLRLSSALAPPALTRTRQLTTILRADGDDEEPPVFTTRGGNQQRSGTSFDQDGKANIWSLEPKVKVDADAVQGTPANLLLAVAGVLAIVIIAATSFILPEVD